jgi:hypothetical protein
VRINTARLSGNTVPIRGRAIFVDDNTTSRAATRYVFPHRHHRFGFGSSCCAPAVNKSVCCARGLLPPGIAFLAQVLDGVFSVMEQHHQRVALVFPGRVFGFDHGVGHPMCICVKPKYRKTRDIRRLRVSTLIQSGRRGDQGRVFLGVRSFSTTVFSPSLRTHRRDSLDLGRINPEFAIRLTCSRDLPSSDQF